MTLEKFETLSFSFLAFCTEIEISTQEIVYRSTRSRYLAVRPNPDSSIELIKAGRC